MKMTDLNNIGEKNLYNIGEKNYEVWFPPSGNLWSERRLKELTRNEALELWKECPAAEISELVGEYKGFHPTAGEEERQKATAGFHYDEYSPNGYWLGKAFWPLSKTKGVGYNRFRLPDGSVQRYARFATEMGTSLIDGKPSLLMYYSAYRMKNPWGAPPPRPDNLEEVPEENSCKCDVRKLADGVYLAISHIIKPDGSGTRTNPLIEDDIEFMAGNSVWALVGPIGEYVRADNPTEELI